MSFLDDLSEDERNLLVSLPYRVGLMVSQSDTSGGDESDAEELRALSNILGGYAGEVFGCETVQYIISETVKRQDLWPQWQEEVGDVVADCRRAVYILVSAVDEKEVSGFKLHLMEVGEAVALAFREVEDLSFVDNIKLQILYQKMKYKAQKEGRIYKAFDEFLNISTDERAALEKIAEALEIEYAV